MPIVLRGFMLILNTDFIITTKLGRFGVLLTISFVQIFYLLFPNCIYIGVVRFR